MQSKRCDDIDELDCGGDRKMGKIFFSGTKDGLHIHCPINSKVDPRMKASAEKQIESNSSKPISAENQNSLSWLDDLGFSVHADPFHSDWPHWSRGHEA
jgi:hypothetical protein